jgi:hypothetical protein
MGQGNNGIEEMEPDPGPDSSALDELGTPYYNTSHADSLAHVDVLK